MKQRLLTLLTLLFFAGTALAQQRHCAADEVFQNQIKSNPEFAEKHAAIEQHTSRFVEDFAAGRVSGNQVIIPCIVHVVYANAQENISDAQIQSQIDRLNLDYGATNADYNQVPSTFTNVRSGDTGIRFELIEIKRYSNSRSTWGTNDLVKQTYPPIEPARILNMWVADIGGGILGYAQFPGGSPSTDGVVMSPQYFGDASASGGSNFYLSAPFNLGRTATHEVGHWLNLRHIWGDGGCNVDDFVNDTPVSGNPNYGCPAAGTNSCSGGLSDMFMNYMDYVDDACMFMFSAGQDARMQATFSNGGGREGFLLDPVYNPGGGSGGGGGGSTCADTEVTLTLVTDNYGSETSWSLTSGSTTIASGSGYGNNQTITQTFCLADGDYTFTINDSYGDGICCSYGNGSYSLSDGSTTYASGGSFTSSESTSFTIGGGTPPAPCNTPTGLSSSAITTSSFTLSWSAVSGAVSYDVDVNGSTFNSTGTSLNLTGASPSTTYTCSVRTNCADGSSAYSSSISVTTEAEATGGAPTGYCSAAGQNSSDEWIQRVQLGSINNNSGNNGGYGDFTNLSTNLAKGSSYTITITPGWAGRTYREAYRVYIDYNRDGDFNDSGELVYSRSRTTASSVSGSFTVPSSASSGLTRMRVLMKYNANPSQCETFTYGEVEDYLVNLGGTAREMAPTTPATTSVDHEISVYPNPARDFAKVSMNLSAGTEAFVRLMDLQGREIQQKVVSGEGFVEHTIPVQGLTKGLYVVTVTIGGETSSHKIVVK